MNVKYIQSLKLCLSHIVCVVVSNKKLNKCGQVVQLFPIAELVVSELTNTDEGAKKSRFRYAE